VDDPVGSPVYVFLDEYVGTNHSHECCSRLDVYFARSWIDISSILPSGISYTNKNKRLI
jgi:hypothetical protein